MGYSNSPMMGCDFSGVGPMVGCGVWVVVKDRAPPHFISVGPRMSRVVLLPLKMEVQLVIFSHLD